LKSTDRIKNLFHSEEIVARRRLIIPSSLVFIMVAQITYAAQEVQMERPSFIKTTVKNACAAQLGQAPEMSEQQFDAVAENQAKRTIVAVKNGGYKLTEEQEPMLANAIKKNRAVQRAVTDILSDKNADHKNINQIRLEILTLLADFDPYDSSQVQQASNDADAHKVLQLVTFVSELNPRSASQKSLANATTFLKEVKSAIASTAPLSKVLQIAADTLAIEKGYTVHVDHIDQYQKSPGGMMELFKTDDDATEIEIPDATGKSALKVWMSVNEATAIEEKAGTLAQDLIEMARDPSTIADKLNSVATASLKRKMTDVNDFMKDNPLLDKKNEATLDGKETRDQVAENLSDLLRQLEDYGNVTRKGDPIANMRRGIRKVPGFKWVKDPIDALTIKGKINEIDKSLVKGATDMEANNIVLMDLKARALKQIRALEYELAQAQFLSQHVTYYTDKLEGNGGDPRVVQTLRSEIIPHIEKGRAAVLDLSVALNVSLQAIDAVVKLNQGLIDSAAEVRRVAMPLITVNHSIKAAAAEAEKHLKIQRAIRATAQKLMEQLPEQIARADAAFIAMSSEPIISAESVEKVMLALKEGAEKRRLGNIEAGKLMAAANARLSEVKSANALSLHDIEIGGATHAILKGGGEKK
jgi:uncharacterized protein YaaN involved in tellurite resistance